MLACCAIVRASVSLLFRLLSIDLYVQHHRSQQAVYIVTVAYFVILIERRIIDNENYSLVILSIFLSSSFYLLSTSPFRCTPRRRSRRRYHQHHNRHRAPLKKRTSSRGLGLLDVLREIACETARYPLLDSLPITILRKRGFFIIGPLPA